MTNGFVQPVVVAAARSEGGDQSLVVKYPEGEKTIIVSASGTLRAMSSAARTTSSRGAPFRIPDGRQAARRHLYGQQTSASARTGPAVLAACPGKVGTSFPKRTCAAQKVVRDRRALTMRSASHEVLAQHPIDVVVSGRQ